ncbi:MAG: hydroxyphenylacetyl-CoA thioesterase PaaI [Litorimonas sp.]
MNDADKLAQKVARKMLSDEGTGPAWGLSYDDGGEGWAQVSFRVKADMLNGHGTIHGGMLFALADTALAYACNSRNNRTVAQQASIAFLSPVEMGEKVMATAREEALQGRSGVYNVKLTGEDGRTVATFQGLSRAIRGHVIDLSKIPLPKTKNKKDA